MTLYQSRKELIPISLAFSVGQLPIQDPILACSGPDSQSDQDNSPSLVLHGSLAPSSIYPLGIFGGQLGHPNAIQKHHRGHGGQRAMTNAQLAGCLNEFIQGPQSHRSTQRRSQVCSHLSQAQSPLGPILHLHANVLPYSLPPLEHREGDGDAPFALAYDPWQPNRQVPIQGQWIPLASPIAAKVPLISGTTFLASHRYPPAAAPIAALIRLPTQPPFHFLFQPALDPARGMFPKMLPDLLLEFLDDGFLSIRVDFQYLFDYDVHERAFL
jgi:hypothetical protein